MQSIASNGDTTMLKPRITRRLLRNTPQVEMTPVNISLELLEMIIAEVDNTPTLATFMRVSRTTHGIARKYLYHTVELGGNDSKTSENDLTGFLVGFKEESRSKLDCLSLSRILIVKCKIHLQLSSDQIQRLFPNLDTLVLPSFACQIYPTAFSLSVFAYVKHLVISDFRASQELLSRQYLSWAHADISLWTQLRKISLYNAQEEPREAGRALEYYRPPKQWKALQEIVVWPAFHGVTQIPDFNPFRSLPELADFPHFELFTVMVPKEDADDCIARYAPFVDKLGEKERGMVRYQEARATTKTRRDPILEEDSDFREWD